MSKRKYDELDDTNVGNVAVDPANVKTAFKNSLDSDESDDEEAEERYDVMTETQLNKIMNERGGKGEERLKQYKISNPTNEASGSEVNTGFTGFNMKDELEDGHFDNEGHFHWKKDKEIRDNWLDNIDWLKVEPKKTEGGNDDSEDSEEEDGLVYDPRPIYEQILEYLKPGETISKALQRIGGKLKNLTTAQRWKRRKDPETAKEDTEISKTITLLTDLANKLLTQTGNMDIYQESYEQIKKKVTAAEKHKMEAELDMYADDFDTKEKEKMGEDKPADASTSEEANDSSVTDTEVKWELKWSQDADAKVHGPHTSVQMHEWSNDGFFKKGAWVRKVGTEGEFHNAARIDFELYI